MASRAAGLLIPLFSAPSSESWGIGDIGDIAPLSEWLGGAGVSVLQLLPLNEMAPAQQSPYSAISAMAIDPIYIRVPSMPEFARLGGEAALDAGDRQELQEARSAPRVEYPIVRRLKQKALGLAFERFLDDEWRRDSQRASALRAFIGAQSWWLDEYVLFRVIHAKEDEHPWMAWPAPFRDRDPSALDQACREWSREMLFQQYLQWTAALQWNRARADANGLRLFGDLPFMVDGDSADVWSRREEFRLDVSLGAPPDAFSASGQDWGVPVYRWDAIAATGFAWQRNRARRNRDLYDGWRIDHLVGFYRTYGRPRDGQPPFFTPADEPAQLALGEHVIGLFRQSGADVIAEDLGTVPDFVRASLARLGVPGFKVFRWERFWEEQGQPFRDPADYPALSVAASGTHDTETLVVWWAQAPEEERRAIADLPTIRNVAGGADISEAPEAVVRDVLLEALYASESRLLLLPVQDVFGWRDRINEPALVNDVNWTFRLPWPIDRMSQIPQARERQRTLRRWAKQCRRV